MMTESRGPLAGVRVVELGNFIAAPTAGRLLGDFGADVIKVERPGTGDELRTWRRHGGETSLLFRTLGRNKRSLTLDLRTEEGRAIALKLIARADVVLENFRPGALERWSMGPEVMKEVNPDLILVRVSVTDRRAHTAIGQVSGESRRPSAVCVTPSGIPIVRRCG